MNTLALFKTFAADLPLLAEAKLSTQIITWAAVLLVTGLLLTPSLRAWMTGVLAVLIGAIVIGVGVQISPLLVVGTVLGAIGLICLLPPSRRDLRAAGAIFFALALGFYGYAVAIATPTPGEESVIAWVVFILLALTTVGSALAMITSRSAVYSAIWFALTLLATGGLFLYQGAQFLGVATVTVYAGAIVVTFLFVIMLAQPDGHAAYDRISWGWFAKPAAALAAATLMGAVLYGLHGAETGGTRELVGRAVDDLAKTNEPLPFTSAQIVKANLVGPDERSKLQMQLRSDAADVTLSKADAVRLATAVSERRGMTTPPRIELLPALAAPHDTLAGNHMAHLGGYLFSRHLIAVEVAGTLLLAALVGAIAMLSQGASTRHEGEARG
jgi:NADH:ubiquinone oxidoreductase subunit 6 (subunit J)